MSLRHSLALLFFEFHAPLMRCVFMRMMVSPVFLFLSFTHVT